MNNTVHESTGSGGAGIYIAGENVKNVLIRNNVVAFGPMYVGQIRAASMDGVAADHNLTHGPVKFPDSEVPGSLVADPKFADPAGGDLHLLPDSPAIDGGSPVDAPADDFDGVSRPRGAGWDMGAYEHVGAAQGKVE